MNTLELADYLSIIGYNVYKKEGVDIEALLTGCFNVKPIDYDKLERAAEKEGFVLNGNYWMKKEECVS